MKELVNRRSPSSNRSRLAHLLFIQQLSEHREKPVALHPVAVVGKGLRQVAQRGLLLYQFEQLLGVTPDYVRGQR